MSRKLVLKNVRFSYARVFEAQKFDESDDVANYSVTVLILKSDTANIKLVKDAIKAEMEDFKAHHPGKAKLGDRFWIPLRDGDEKDDEGYEGNLFFQAKRKESLGQPIVIDKRKVPITVKEDFYSGCWGTISCTIQWYDKKGEGIRIGLNGVQKVTDDTPFGGSIPSMSDFEDEGTEDEKANNPLNDFLED